jgi:hypothetical protein
MPDSLYGLYLTVADAGSLANTSTGVYVDVSTANSSDTTYAAILLGGNVGIGDASPAAALTVGNGDLFQVASTGILTSLADADFTFTDGENFTITSTSNSDSSIAVLSLTQADYIIIVSHRSLHLH